MGRDFWRSLFRFERGRLDPRLAFRNTIGVVLPLVVGAAFGSIRTGVVVASGALNVCYADGQEPYPQRARRMLAASGLVGLAVFAGALTGRQDAVAVAVSAVCALGAGMLAALSTRAADSGAMSLVTLVVFAALPMPPQQAALSGALAAAGGLFQTALALSFWPVRRRNPERLALAAFYAERRRRSMLSAACWPARTAHAMMALEAGLETSRPVPAREAFRKLATDIELTLAALAEAPRTSSVPAGMPDLRKDHVALTRSEATGERYALVNVEADRIVNGLNTFRKELERWLERRGREASAGRSVLGAGGFLRE